MGSTVQTAMEDDTSAAPSSVDGLPVSRRNLMSGTARLAATAVVAPAMGALPAFAADVGGTGPSLDGALTVPPRVIPVPGSISPEGQRFLAKGGLMIKAAGNAPPASDIDAWRKRIVMANKFAQPVIDKLLANPAKVERRTIGGANVCVGTPDVMRHPDRARVTIHGGAFTLLGGAFVMGDACQSAAEAGCVAFSIDYRMPPDFPYPAAVDDCIAAYREIIKSYAPKKIVISGPSAGGNLAAAVTLKLRDLGLPMPGAVGMMSPVTDLTNMSDTLNTNLGVDTALARDPVAELQLYANGHDTKDPYLSPIFGDFAKGFPPSFLQSGTRDLLLSDTVRLHRALLRAGIEAELHIWEAMPHGGFGYGTPEALEVRVQFLKFMDKHLG